MTESIDLLICPEWIVPVQPEKTVLNHHSVAVRDGTIIAVCPNTEATLRFSPRETLCLPGEILIPGLINLHTHAAMALMRGMADDLPLMQWLQEAIWPTEAKHVSEAFVRDGTLLAAAEMLRGGITTCNEMYFYPDAAAQAFADAGMRAVVGIAVLEFPTPYASNADEYFQKGLKARDNWHKHPLISFALAPHAPYTVSDDSLQRVASLAAELDIPIHMHVHETAHEIDESVAQHGCRPLTRLERLGLLGPGFISVHSVHLNEDEIALLAHHGCSIAHCPGSNMKLASGIAPIAACLDHGITVGLGTDGAASNNRLDVLEEMRLTALLAKVSTQNPTAIPAHTALRMATLDGARALGLDHIIGSIEAGKQADLCSISVKELQHQPCYDPISHLVYVIGRDAVTHTWVNGQLRVKNGKTMLQNHNIELLGRAAMWQTSLE